MKLKNRKINKKRIIRNIIILSLIIIGCISFNNTSLSRTQISYKTIYTSFGDTLWSIAKKEQKNNEYYNKDIRDIIEEIRQVNNLNDTQISINQKLEIPTIK